LADEIERNEKEKEMVNQIRIELYEEKQAEREQQLADVNSIIIFYLII